MPPFKPLEDRFWEKVELRDDTEDSCWIWTGYTHWNGYGIIGSSRDEKRFYVHRFSYELVYGQIPEGGVVHHICRVKTCVNPSHLLLCDSAKSHRLLHLYE
jgi:hypothetical protein